MAKTIIIIGGGAAGIFAACAAAACAPLARILVLEKTNGLLAKVRISGGGRCNVTHSCFEPPALIKNYPRGGQALLGPFHRFQPLHTMEWFKKRGVDLKTEEDGRIFPITDNSQTIIDCLLKEAGRLGVEIKLKMNIASVFKENHSFIIRLENEEELRCDALLLATGSRKEGLLIAEKLGHQIVLPVPSLFSFNIANFMLKELSGISTEEAELKIEGTDLKQRGPLLITHWGFSGPAALKLSAWAARVLFEKEYSANLLINWLPLLSEQELLQRLLDAKQKAPSHSIQRENSFGLAKNLWIKLLQSSSIDPETRLNDLSKKQLLELAKKLRCDCYKIEGKTPYKQEFVTCGGVFRDQVNFKTMESQICNGLYFAGEVLDIDGVTGGFNFQNAWTTGWIAGNSMVSP